MNVLAGYNQAGEHVHHVTFSLVGGTLNIRVVTLDGRGVNPEHLQFHTSSQRRHRVDGLSLSYTVHGRDYVTQALPVRFLFGDANAAAPSGATGLCAAPVHA